MQVNQIGEKWGLFFFCRFLNLWQVCRDTLRNCLHCINMANSTQDNVSSKDQHTLDKSMMRQQRVRKLDLVLAVLQLAFTQRSIHTTFAPTFLCPWKSLLWGTSKIVQVSSGSPVEEYELHLRKELENWVDCDSTEILMLATETWNATMKFQEHMVVRQRAQSTET